MMCCSLIHKTIQCLCPADVFFYTIPMKFSIDNALHPRPAIRALSGENSSTSGPPPSSSMSLLSHGPMEIKNGAGLRIAALSTMAEQTLILTIPLFLLQL